ncbi:MAG: decaprenyl-phosphate phosphoribosyltransferase [Myxococcales bacterium]|nr:decaprenyl-phosphate phosphoribosyltransferase [Myxococcales bacterium]
MCPLRPPPDPAPSGGSATPTPPPGRTSSSPPGPSDAPPPLPHGGRRGPLTFAAGVLRTLRPHQWVKNLFVVAPVVFAKNLTHPSIITRTAGAFAIFCLLAGAVYALNDIVDADADRRHPVKRRRPIAAGVVPVAFAKLMVVVLLLVAFTGAALGPPLFLAVTVAYFVENLAYSLWLKRVAYVDVGLIAFGFVLRVLAGGFATLTPISGYMIACTAMLALFLGFGKRRHEVMAPGAEKQRAALRAYSPRALTIALAVTGVASVAAYVLYTLDSHTTEFFKSDLLWLTAIHPAFGVVRFLQLVRGRPKAESPTQEMLSDVPFVLNVFVWVAEIVVIVYRLRPT